MPPIRGGIRYARNRAENPPHSHKAPWEFMKYRKCQEWREAREEWKAHRIALLKSARDAGLSKSGEPGVPAERLRQYTERLEAEIQQLRCM